MKGHRHLTIVIKLGTSSIVDEKTRQPLLSTLSLIVETAVKLREDGHRVVIVSSGAIGVGLRRMDVGKRPKHLPRIQALAAVGQCRLIGLWDSLFAHLRQPVAQILLTRNDIADRTQYLNAQNTIVELLNMGVIPIVNENDTIAVTEIKFGDNDTLSAITSGMVQADFLFLMTDVDCLYDKNPRTHADAKAIEVVADISALAADVSSAGSSLGTGGMSTKIVAARLATSAGVTTVITRSSNPGNVAEIVKYVQDLKQQSTDSLPLPNNGATSNTAPSSIEEPLSRSITSLPGESPLKPPLHTRFLPDPQPIRDRSFWLLHGLAPHGTIYIDEGAHRALIDKAGLLPVGVVDVEGHFAQQEAVRIVVVKRLRRHAAPTIINPSTLSSTSNQSLPEEETNPAKPTVHEPFAVETYEKNNPPPQEVGRAVVNYSVTEIARIKGLRSTQIQTVLGYADSEYVALRENISLFKTEGHNNNNNRSRAATPVSGYTDSPSSKLSVVGNEDEDMLATYAKAGSLAAFESM